LSGSSKNSTKTTISTPLSIRSQNKQTNNSSPTTTSTVTTSSSSSSSNNNNKSQNNWPCVIASSIDEINCRPILHTTSAKLNHHQINPKRISVYKCNSIVGCAIKFLTEAIFDFKHQDQDKENGFQNTAAAATTDILLNNETRRRPTKKKSLRVFTDSSFLMITNSSSNSSFNTHQQRLRFTRDIESNGVVPIKTNHDLINDLINRQLDARETVKSIYNLSSSSPAVRKQINSNKNLQASNKSLFNNNNNNNIKSILISNSNSKIPYIDDDNDDDDNNVEQVVLIEPSNQNLINIIQNNKRLNEYVDLITLSSTSTTTKSRFDFNYDNYNDQSQQQQQQQQQQQEYDSNYLEDINNFNNDNNNNNNRSLSLNILSKKLKSNSKQTTMSTSPNAIYKRPIYEHHHHHHHVIRHRGSNCHSDQYYDDYEFDYEFECINNEEILNFNFDNNYNYNDEVNGKSY